MVAEGESDVNAIKKMTSKIYNFFDGPTTWFREKVVESNRPTYYWYHRKFRRVPTIDQCYTDDIVCVTEADEQFKLDRRIDAEVLCILRERMLDCNYYENPDHKVKCAPLVKSYEEAANNYFIKYGDMTIYSNVVDCFMKQKHRMIWERRHGPVGSGMKPKEEWGKGNNNNNEE